mgnify:CR=1 FL=1
MYTYELQVIEKKKLSPTAACIRLGLNGKEFKFIPGQYVQAEIKLEERNRFKVLNNKPKIQKRSFSISSSPNEKKYIEFTCKTVPNGFVSVYIVNHLKVGDKIKIKGPMGNSIFNEKKTKNNLVFLAGGSGISPMISMLRYINENKIDVNATIIYSNKTEDEILHRNEIENLSKKNKNIKYIFTLTQQEWEGRTGRIDKELISSNAKKIKPQDLTRGKANTNLDGAQDPKHLLERVLTETDFYIVGPPPFVEEMEKILNKLKVKEDSIKKEMY